MKQALRPTFQHICVQSKRLVAFVLLAGIAYSVTFGSAHSHADPTEQANANLITSIGVDAAIGPITGHAGGIDDQDCLICRFHQQLFNSVVHARLFVAEPEMRRLHTADQGQYSYDNTFVWTPISRHSGRAPPLA